MSKKLARELLEQFTPLNPVVVLLPTEARSIFGEFYKYDLPKYCAQHNLTCYFVPSTMMYVILSEECKPA